MTKQLAGPRIAVEDMGVENPGILLQLTSLFTAPNTRIVQVNNSLFLEFVSKQAPPNAIAGRIFTVEENTQVVKSFLRYVRRLQRMGVTTYKAGFNSEFLYRTLKSKKFSSKYPKLTAYVGTRQKEKLVSPTYMLILRLGGK